MYTHKVLVFTNHSDIFKADLIYNPIFITAEEHPECLKAVKNGGSFSASGKTYTVTAKTLIEPIIELEQTTEELQDTL